jgi:formate dehydrogenase major subunit
MQPSGWQKEYSRFTEVQERLLAERHKAGATPAIAVPAK